MNWGKAIILSFVLFAVFIGVLVNICVREDISLVSKNYYQEELVYQKQIERLNNTNQLKEKPMIISTGRDLEIHFGELANLEQGEIKLFCPSDIRFDRQFILHPSPGAVQRFKLGPIPKGMYRAKMRWTMKGKEYYFEDIITL